LILFWAGVSSGSEFPLELFVMRSENCGLNKLNSVPRKGTFIIKEVGDMTVMKLAVKELISTKTSSDSNVQLK